MCDHACVCLCDYGMMCGNGRIVVIEGCNDRRM